MAIEEGLLLVGDGAVVLDLHLVRGEAHEAGDLLDGDAAGEVLGALLGRKAPVLVGDELARALEVLERVAVLLDQLEAGLGRVGELLAVAVVNDRVAVAGVGLRVAVALGSRGGAAVGGAAREREETGGDGAACEEAPARDVGAHDFSVL